MIKVSYTTHAFFWLLGFTLIALIWAGCPFLLAYPISVGLVKAGWSPLWAWVGIPVIYYSIYGYLFSRKTKDKEERC